MAAQFKGKPPAGPRQISSEPQKEKPTTQGEVLQSGLDQRPFSDSEIKEAFDTFDLDRNRFVGAAELQHILQLIGEDVTDEEIDEMIRICDTDGDGQVTFDEFKKMMTTPPPPVPPPMPKTSKTRSRAAAAKKYQRSTTQSNFERSQTEANLEAAMGHDTAKTSKQKQGLAEKQKQEAQANFRAVSVETLVRKLSGGMGKIKPSQIKKVYKRFQDIDADKSGAIDYDEFIQALEMEDNTVAKQMFRVFDMDGSGSIELKEFIVVLSRYTSAAKTEKLKFAFMMFDEDGSGFIERAELIDMLGASFVVEGYSPEELEDRADMVFDFLQMSRDGAISYEDFLKLSTAKNGLIYPLEETRHTLGGDMSIDAMVDEADANA